MGPGGGVRRGPPGNFPGAGMRLPASFGPRPGRPRQRGRERPLGTESLRASPGPAALGPCPSPRLCCFSVRQAQVCAGAEKSPSLPCFPPGCKCSCREIDQLLARLRFREPVANASALFLCIFKTCVGIKPNYPQKSTTPVQKSLSSGDAPYPVWMCSFKISVFKDAIINIYLFRYIKRCCPCN